MKFALAAAAFVALASANRCNKLAERLERRIDRMENRMDMVDEKIEMKMQEYCDLFNSDETNSARVADLTMEGLMGYVEGEILAQQESGAFSSDNSYQSDINVGDCDVAAELEDYESALMMVRKSQDCWKFLTDEEASPMTADLAAWLSCDNAVFASGAECVAPAPPAP